jgi:hypothetical protein
MVQSRSMLDVSDAGRSLAGECPAGILRLQRRWRGPADEELPRQSALDCSEVATPESAFLPEPFTVQASAKALADLRARLRATHWSDAPEDVGW